MPSFAKPETAALDARVIGLSGYSIFKGDTLTWTSQNQESV
jgi:hypothetical protein